MSTTAHLEVFPSEYHMIKFFGQYLPDLDVDGSARVGHFTYIYDGEWKVTKSLYAFLEEMDQLTALGVDYNSSRQKGAAFLVFFHDTPKAPKPFVAKVTEIKSIKESSILSTTFSQEGEGEDTTPPAHAEGAEKVEEKVEGNPEKDAILAHAETLRDDSKKAASKAALEAYALEKGVSLSKAKTFDGMMEDFAAAL